MAHYKIFSEYYDSINAVAIATGGEKEPVSIEYKTVRPEDFIEQLEWWILDALFGDKVVSSEMWKIVRATNMSDELFEHEEVAEDEDEEIIEDEDDPWEWWEEYCGDPANWDDPWCED